MRHKVKKKKKKIIGSERTLEKTTVTTPLLHCLKGLWSLFGH